LTGLKANSSVTLYAFTTTEKGHKFESMAHLIADKNGMLKNVIMLYYSRISL